MQQEKRNRKREEELGDWLTFPVHAVAVGLAAVAPTASGVCDERGEPPGGRPHFHPMGTGHRAERRHQAGSPERHLASFNKNIKHFVSHKSKDERNEM